MQYRHGMCFRGIHFILISTENLVQIREVTTFSFIGKLLRGVGGVTKVLSPSTYAPVPGCE
jgi:hypothetical protein